MLLESDLRERGNGRRSKLSRTVRSWQIFTALCWLVAIVLPVFVSAQTLIIDTNPASEADRSVELQDPQSNMDKSARKEATGSQPEDGPPEDISSPEDVSESTEEVERYTPKWRDVDFLIQSLPDSWRANVVNLPSQPDDLVIAAPPPLCKQIKAGLEELDQPHTVALHYIVCLIPWEHRLKCDLDWQRAVNLTGESKFNFGLSGLSLSEKAVAQDVTHTFTTYEQTTSYLMDMDQNKYLSLLLIKTEEVFENGFGESSAFQGPVVPFTALTESCFQYALDQEIDIEVDLQHVGFEESSVIVDMGVDIQKEFEVPSTRLNKGEFPSVVAYRTGGKTTVAVAAGETFVTGGRFSSPAGDFQVAVFFSAEAIANP